MITLVHALDRADKNLVATRHEVVEQHLTLSVTYFLQNDLLGRHRADTANGHGLDRFFDVLVHLDVRNLLFGFKQQNLLLWQLQARLIGNHMPAAEGFVITAVAINRHANIHLARVQLFGRLGQRRLNSAQHHVTLYVFLA